MSKHGEIKAKLQEIVGANPNLPFTAIVKSVELDHCTVTIDDFDVSDVKLKATISDGENYIQTIPKVGSKVLILSLSGDLRNLCVIKYDEVEKLIYKQDGLEFVIDSTDKKVSIKNNEVSLVEILEQLAATLKQLKVHTSTGPSGIPIPTSITAITEFETDIKKILK